MKLSEMTNDQAANAMIALADPVGRLCDDAEAVKLIEDTVKQAKENKKTPVTYVVWRIIPKMLAFFMDKHKADIYAVISALSGIPEARIGGMNFAETVKVVRDSYDDMLMTFFISSAEALPGGGGKSSGN